MATQSLERKQRPALMLLCLAQFVLVLDFAIVNVALPTIKTSLDFTSGQLPWVVGAYALFFGGFLLVGGRAGDIFGRKRMFVTGLAIFAIASLAGGLATEPIVLIIARSLQGLSAAAVSPAVLALIGAGYAEGEARNHAMGVFGAVSSAGFTGGVLFGGILTQYFGWRAVMFVNVPACIALVVMAIRRIQDDRPSVRQGKIDIPGAFLVTAGMCSIIYALTVAADQGWSSTQVVWPAGIGVALLVAFVILQAKLVNPLMPLDLFRSRSVTGGNLIAFLSGGVMAISTFFFTLYMHSLGYSAIKTGLAFFPQAFIVILASLPVVRMTDKFGARPVLTGGGVFLVVGSLLLSRAPADGSFLLNILPGGLLIGIGVTVMMITTAVAATSGVEARRMGLASGVYNSFRQLGVGLCLAAGVAIASAAQTGASIDSIRAGFTVSTVLSVSIVAAALLVLPRLVPSKASQQIPAHGKEMATAAVAAE